MKEENPEKALVNEKGTVGSTEEGGVVVNEDGSEVPTEEELRTLVRVADEIPLPAMLIVLCEFAERFSYCESIFIFDAFRNFIERPLPLGGNGAGSPPKNSILKPGALDQGIQTAVAVTTFFSFWAYIMPIFGAIMADQYWGRFKTIAIFTAIVGLGHVVLVACSVPSLLQNNPSGAFAGFMVSILIIGIGTGGIKANVSPLVAEQYTKHGQWVRTNKDGKRVIVDSNLTIPFTFVVRFYLLINVGSLGSLATVECEKLVGFWLAYLIPTIVYLLLPIVLYLGRNRYVKTPAKGSVVLESVKVFRLAYRSVWSLNPLILWKNLEKGPDWDAARPTIDDETKGSTLKKWITWDSQFVDEIRRTLFACKVFLLYPLFWISYNQMTSNLTNQAGYMDTGNTPNDLLNNLDPIAIIIIIPIMVIYLTHSLRRVGIVVRPIQRITLGFFFASAAMVYAAVLQASISKGDSPCGKFGNECAEGVAPINVWVQAPAYILIGTAEVGIHFITGLEYAYTKAPLRMKSVVFALYFLTTAVSNAISLALAPVSVDPFVLYNYVGCAGASFIGGVLFYWLFRNFDKAEDEINSESTRRE
ncbi:PTR2-domain-containing protein [Hysterangium stoloniferum]|nr:PTR2-domain-containing protein [Hysterangium stoloniferum]